MKESNESADNRQHEQDGAQPAAHRQPRESKGIRGRAAYLRKRAAAEYMGISVRTLTDLMRRGVVPYRKLTRKLCLFRIEELDRALDRFYMRSVGE